MIRIYKVAVIIFFVLSGCVALPDTIRDVRELNQDHAAYLAAGANGEGLLSAAAQIQLDEDYNANYFSIWHQSQPFHALPDRVAADFKYFAARPGYGENKKKHAPGWLKKLQHKAALNSYPNSLSRGITTRNTSLRGLPTNQPHFHAKDGDSSAWPFDNLQRSLVPVNTPIFICHFSADKSWALVETSFTFGWIPAEDFAAVDDAFIKDWETGRYAVIVRDQTVILDENDRFLASGKVGHIFPLITASGDKTEVSIAVADRQGQAVIRRGYVSTEAAALKPLRFNLAQAARIANEMIGEPYGWGGLYGNRDCSSMTRDFFAVFGIWLPRHSADQVREVGKYVNLKGLEPTEKEKIILDMGVPYLSLLWRKGHVMLYIGASNGRALIFHNMWGIRTRDLQGREGRKIIGKAVITTLEPGWELRDSDLTSGSLLNNIEAMSVLSEVTPEKKTK